MAAHFEVRRSKLRRNRWHVVLVGRNGEPLSTSETLNSIDAVNVNVAAQREAIDQSPLVEWPSH